MTLQQFGGLTNDNESTLQSLLWTVEMSEGIFSLTLVVCNYSKLQDCLIEELQNRSPIKIREVVLEPSVTRLYPAIASEIKTEKPAAMMVLGMESVSAIKELLITMNQAREEFRDNFPFPLFLWVTTEVYNELFWSAPDFKSWTTTVEFGLSTEELIDLLKQTSDKIFFNVLKNNNGKFLDNSTFNMENWSGLRQQLESGLSDLQEQELPEIKATLKFVMGREKYTKETLRDLDEALSHYQQSLEIWQHLKNPERAGILLFYIGFCYGLKAKLQRAKSHQHLENARDFCQQGLDIFEQAERQDLVVIFINQLNEVLRRLKSWEQLKILAEKSSRLHQTSSNKVQLAQDYGFLAEVYLAYRKGKEANRRAEQALSLFDAVSGCSLEDKGWYLLLLAKSQRHLNQIKKAITNLEKARKELHPTKDNSRLYIRILETLHSCYYVDQHEYLKAFRVKQEQQKVEQQYGFRAFIGAGRLEPKLQDANHSSVAPEIRASGRENDLKNLINRIKDKHHTLTVIYGKSGVGKSSILRAGLVPKLKETFINGRRVVTVILEVYENWIEELSSGLAKAVNLPATSSLDTVIAQLRENSENNLVTVLIFDQFEEFLFSVKEPAKREQFWKFLHQRGDIRSLNIILSIRQDHIGELFEYNRLHNQDSYSEDIVDKNNRYSFGDFSLEQAKSVIRFLTEKSQFNLEPALIEQLVQDLSGEIKSVRPIELQLVGARLQTENITTLAAYQKLGDNPKDALVDRFLNEIVKDCGTENRNMAWSILYFFTDKNDTRPLKTEEDLQSALMIPKNNLSATVNWFLEIFTESGLVSVFDRKPRLYQLIHDYLVPLIRKQDTANLIAKYKQEVQLAEQKQQESERKRNILLKQALVGTAAGFVICAGLATWAYHNWQKAEIGKLDAEINAFSAKSDQLLGSGKIFDAMIESLRVGKKLKTTNGVSEKTKIQALTSLQQTFYNVKERNRLEGHEGVLTSVIFSGDGKLIASGSEDKTVKLWQKDGKLLHTLKGHADKVTSVSFSPDSKLIISGSEDKTIKFWSLDGKIIKTLKGHGDKVTSVRFSPDGKLIASASEDKTVKLWNLEGKEIKTLKGHDESVSSISFSPNSKTIATASKDNKVKLWNLDGTVRTNISIWGVTSVSFNPDGKTIATGSINLIKIWSLDGKLLTNLANRSGTYNGMSFSPNGKIIATTQKNSDVVRILKSDGTREESLPGHSSDVSSISFSPDGKTLASASEDKTIKLWNIGSKNLKTGEVNRDRISNVKFSPDSHSIAAVSNGGISDTIQLWTLNQSLHLVPIKGYSTRISFSPDGQTLASASRNDTIKIWKKDGTLLLPKLRGHQAWVNCVSISPDGKLIASGGRDNTIKIWKKDGTLIKTLTSHKDEISSLRFSPDGKLIASGSRDNTVKLWKIDGTLLKTLSGHQASVYHVMFSPDSQLLVSGGNDYVVNLWQSDGIVIATLKGHESVLSDVQFSPDSKIIATASSDQMVKLWNRKGEEIKTIEGHRNSVNSVRFSPNGKHIVTASSDKNVKLWNYNGQLIRTLKHSVAVSNAQFFSKGKVIVSMSNDNVLRLWNINGTFLREIKDNRKGDSNKEPEIHIWSGIFSPDHKTIATIDSKNITKLWDLNGKQTASLPGWNSSVTFSDDGQLIATASKEDAVKLWSRNGKLVKTFLAHSDWIAMASFSPDGQLIATGSQDKTVKLWNLEGKEIKTFKGHTAKVTEVSFSPDGSVIASASWDKTLKLWRRDGTLPKTLKGHTDIVYGVSFSPDGKTIASTSADKTVKIWTLEGQEIRTLKGHTAPVFNVSFSPDGKKLASASSSEVILWNQEDGMLLKTLSGFGTTDVSFSPDGKKIAAASIDGAKVWSLDLDELLVKSCDWMQDYLKTNPNLKESDRTLCDDIGTSK